MRPRWAMPLARRTVPAVLAALVVVGAPVRQARGGAESPTSACVREALRNRLEQSLGSAPPVVGDERIHAVTTMTTFFEARAFEPAWTSDADQRAAALELLRAVDRAHEDGLDPADYHADVLKERTPACWAEGRPDAAATVGELVDLELLLTDAFLLLGSHLLCGAVNPETIDPEWFAARRGGDMAATLQQALGSGDITGTLASLAPPQSGYARLKDALAVYRRLEPWTSIEAGPALRAGDRSPRVTALRNRLAATHDLDPDASDQADADRELFDEGLDAAVRRFQLRHGLDVDGVVGKATLAEANWPLGGRIQQIAVNLERWRWLPQSLGRRHVLVNIAGFEVRAVEDGVTVATMRAIVGRPYRRTPVFSDRISYLVLNPSWTIPTLIAVEDKLPLIREDPTYLGRQGITVFSGWGAEARELDPRTVDWTAVSATRFPYRLRQEPGPLNALGTMKFMFPNRFNVYLHDTPGRGLFARSVRDLSSGCIRIERPPELALFVLRPDPRWDIHRLEEALATRQEQTVPLPEPVPVHIEYWTVWVAEGGSVYFRRDLYGRDDQVAAALREPPPEP